MRSIALLLITALALAGCNTSPDASGERDTLSDPLGDIAYANGMIYATNDDGSGHVGSQVDLYAYADGALESPQKTVALELNGYGYLAMASDGVDLYLQPRGRARIIKAAPDGALPRLRDDVPAADARWRGCGLCYDTDTAQLVALYATDRGSLVWRRYDPASGAVVATSPPVVWDVLAPGVWPRAITGHGATFYVLATDTAGVDVVVSTSPPYDRVATVQAVGDQAAGLTQHGAQIWIGYQDRRIETWRGP